MPLNELEEHPYLNYYNLEGRNFENYTGLIIGSYPIFLCTNSLNENLQVVERVFNPDDLRMRFFYGSRKSEFWNYTFSALNVAEAHQGFPEVGLGLAKETAISLLENNNLMITDVIKRTNRNGISSADVDLWVLPGANQFILDNLQLNENIIDLLNLHPAITNLFFTAKGSHGNCPFGWFRQIMGVGLRFEEDIVEGWSKLIQFNERPFNVFFLPTPKPRGIHFTLDNQNPMFVNYLNSVDPLIYHQIVGLPLAGRTMFQRNQLTQYRKSFLIETYRQALVANNLFFNGAI